MCYNIRVNETHICVLRRIENEDRVKMDFVEMKFKYQEQLNELRQMAMNVNYTVLDLQNYVKSTPLYELTRGFDFCWELNGSFQEFRSLPEKTTYTYQTELDGFAKNNYYGFGKQHYVDSMRWDYYRLIEKRVMPYMMQELYVELENDPSVLAFSHRRIGWAFPAFKLNEDIEVVYSTNFGYGTYSSFNTNINYKGVRIPSYSNWVRYRGTSIDEIKGITKRHRVENSEWKNAMAYTAEVYNAAVANPELFVKRYIINDVEEMVSGLENILNSTASYIVCESYFNPGNKTYLTGENLLLFKGEKISGALMFFDDLKKLLPICDSVSSYLKRIMKCNLSIIGELDAAIKNKQDILAKISEEIDKVQSALNEKDADDMNEKMQDLNNQKYAAESFINKLQSYLDKIEQHINSMIDKCWQTN